MKPNVLVVCNKKDPALFMPQALLSSGLSVQVAHNAPDALDRIAVNDPDLNILDMVLPRIGGIALIQMLLKNPTTREISTIPATARTSSASRKEALEAGADAF